MQTVTISESQNLPQETPAFLPKNATETVEKEEYTKLYAALGTIYTLMSTMGALYSRFGIDALRLQAHQGMLTNVQGLLLTKFLDYVGNNRNAWDMGVGLIASDILLTVSEPMVEKHPDILIAMEQIRKWLPYFILTVFFLSNIDTETIKILPWSFGTPNIFDIPAGLFGMLTGAVMYDLYLKTMRKHYSSVMEKAEN